MRTLGPVRVPRYLVPLARRLREREKIISKGIIIDSPDIIAELQPDGRVQPRLRNPVQLVPSGEAVPEQPPGGAGSGYYTEFYCQSGGSNTNAGSDSNNSPKYSTTNGNWNAATSVFTPTDGSNPVSSGVAVGDYVAVMLDGATVASLIARITAVVNAANGAITVSASCRAGSAPATGATGRTLKCGGAWKGMNAGSVFPFDATGLFNLFEPATLRQVRVNLKNDATYSVTSNLSITQSTIAVEGYATTPGDGGKALISTNTTGLGQFQFSFVGQSLCFIDIIWENTGASGTNALLYLGSASGPVFIRNVFRGSRHIGVYAAGGGAIFWGCEWYNNNKSNTAGSAALFTGTSGYGTLVIYGYIHDNTGSNNPGIYLTGAGIDIFNTIIANNGSDGIYNIVSVQAGRSNVHNCDFYNNGRDGIRFESGGGAQGFFLCINNNFVKNAGKAINNNVTRSDTPTQAGILYNNGYGAGTQANGAADVLRSIGDTGTNITYPPDVTPWVSPSTGDFSLNLAEALIAGRGEFTQVDGTHDGTVGYPDIGAAQHGV